MASERYFVKLSATNEIGPISEEGLKLLIGNGTVSNTTLVRTDGSDLWRLHSEIEFSKDPRVQEHLNSGIEPPSFKKNKVVAVIGLLLVVVGVISSWYYISQSGSTATYPVAVNASKTAEKFESSVTTENKPSVVESPSMGSPASPHNFASLSDLLAEMNRGQVGSELFFGPVLEADVRINEAKRYIEISASEVVALFTSPEHNDVVVIYAEDNRGNPQLELFSFDGKSWESVGHEILPGYSTFSSPRFRLDYENSTLANESTGQLYRFIDGKFQEAISP